jgi:aspartyl protease family protein
MLWLGLLGLAVIGFGLLLWLVPGQVQGQDWFEAARLLALLALVSSSLVYARRVDLGRTARNLAIWAVIFVALVAGYSFRDDFASLGQRVRAALLPGYAARVSAHSVVLNRGDDGHFYVMGAVNGHAVRFLVDTGSSDIVLSPADAARIGINPSTLRFTTPSATANGVGYGAAVTADSLTVGPIQLAKITVSVNQAPMPASLLGMTFLGKLDSYEFKGSQLILKWRGA